VAAANVVQALMVAGMLGFQFVLPLYLRRVLGYGPAVTGLAFLPITVAIAAISLGAAPRLNTRFGARAVLLASLPLLAAGLALLTRVSGHESFATGLLPVLVLLGIGAGLALPAVMTLVMSVVSAEDSGVISGLANTTQQVGGALGVAVAATLATWRTSLLLAEDRPAAPALTAGYHLAFGVGAALVVAALAVAIAFLRPARPAAPAPAQASTAQASTAEASPAQATRVDRELCRAQSSGSASSG
jgi:MFS family permease